MTRVINERRTEERVTTNLDARWEGVLNSQTGTVVDLSVGGCFILTPDDVKLRELIRLEIKTPMGSPLYLWGEVVYQVAEMGFALRFTGVGEAERRIIEACMEEARAHTGAAVLL